MEQGKLILWLVEIVKRFGQKSPKFFQIWQVILAILTAITGLPKFLKFISAVHALPNWLNAIANSDAAFAFLGAFIMAFQATQSKSVTVTEQGTIIKETDPAKLPFTAIHEVKIATKEGNNKQQ